MVIGRVRVKLRLGLQFDPNNLLSLTTTLTLNPNPANTIMGSWELPTFICHSTYIMFLITTLEELCEDSAVSANHIEL